MKDNIKSRFYSVDFTVCDYCGEVSIIHYVEYAKSVEVLEALIHKDKKELSRDAHTVVSYTVSKADNDDIREFLLEDKYIAQCILIEMLDIAFNREGQ